MGVEKPPDAQINGRNFYVKKHHTDYHCKIWEVECYDKCEYAE